MPRSGPAFSPEAKRLAVETYLAGKASMGELARELGTTQATISRWVAAARARGVQAPPLDAAARVAAVAPPPAPPRAPPVDMGGGDPRTMIAGMAEIQRRHLEEAERARAMGDPATATRALTAAANVAREIRQLVASIASSGGEAYTFTKEELEAARESVQRKIDSLGPVTCPGCGADLRRLWALEGATAGRNTVTGDGDGTGAGGV